MIQITRILVLLVLINYIISNNNFYHISNQNIPTQIKASLLSSDRLTNINDFQYAYSNKKYPNVKILTGRYETNIIILKQRGLPLFSNIISVLKWSAYGHDIQKLGKIAAYHGNIGILENDEAAAIYTHMKHEYNIIRLRPASFHTMLKAYNANYKIHEWIGSFKSLQDAAHLGKITKTKIPIQLYLFDHYNDKEGFAVDKWESLQKIVDSINPKYISIRGFFTHEGYRKHQRAKTLAQDFIDIVCPVAVKLANKLSEKDPKIQIHWAASTEMERMYDHNSGKLNPPDISNECKYHPKIEFLLRLGSATYGLEQITYANTNGGVKPVLQWFSYISSISVFGHKRIATVSAGTEDGYPSLFIKDDILPYVNINGKKYMLATTPSKDSLLIDVTNGDNIQLGESVCLLCDNPALSDFQSKIVAIDDYNMAICITKSLANRAGGTLFELKEDVCPFILPEFPIF